MRKTLLILTTKNQVKNGLNFIKNSLIYNNVTLIAMNSETHYALKEENIPHKKIEDYLFDGIFSNLDIEAMNLAKNWWRQECFSDLIYYEDFSLAESDQWILSRFFSYVIVTIKKIECIIKKERPKEIIVFDLSQDKIENMALINYEDILIKALIILGRQREVHIKKIKINNEHTSEFIYNGLNKKILKIVAKILGKFIDLMQKYKDKSYKRNVLCLYSLSHIEGIIKEMNNTRFIFTTLPTKRDFFKIFRGNVSFKPLIFFSSKKASIISENYLNKVKVKWPDIIKTPPSISYKNYELWPIIKNKLEFEFFIKFPTIIKEIEWAKYLLIREKIDLILLPSDSEEIYKIFIDVAKKFNIKTLYLLHGIPGNVAYFQVPAIVDKYATWGAGQKEWLCGIGIDEEKIMVTGCPQFDKYKKIEYQKEEICHRLHINPSKVIIVLATTSSLKSEADANLQLIGDEWFDLFRMVIEAVNSSPNCDLLVKFHPCDREMDIHKKMLKEISSKEIPTFQKENVLDTINVCDIWITYPSTTGLEAMILDKSVITIIPEGKQIRNKCFLEAGLIVKSMEELKQSIKEILENRKTRKELLRKQRTYIYEQAYMQDGQASKRVADLIMQMIEESKRSEK